MHMCQSSTNLAKIIPAFVFAAPGMQRLLRCLGLKRAAGAAAAAAAAAAAVVGAGADWDHRKNSGCGVAAAAAAAAVAAVATARVAAGPTRLDRPGRVWGRGLQCLPPSKSCLPSHAPNR